MPERVITKRLLTNALAKTNNISAIAETLGVDRSNLYRAMKHFGITRERRKHPNTTVNEIVPQIASNCVEKPIGEDIAKPVKPRMDISAYNGYCVGDVGPRRIRHF